MSTTHGWTTWDPASITIWEHLPSGVRCQLILQDMQGQQLTPTEWEALEETLPDAAGRSMAHLLLMVGDGEVEVECGGQGDLGACQITNIIGDNLTAHWEIDGKLDGWQIHRGEYDVIFAPEEAALPTDVPAFIQEQRAEALRAIPHGEWSLTEPIEAMEAVLAANTLTLPNTQAILTVSRHAIESSTTWTAPNWETFMTALGAAYIDPALAVANCKAAVRLLTANGFLGSGFSAAGVRSDYSNPPVAAYTVWKLFQLTGDFSLLNECYLPLLRWHDWWWNARDGNHNHLLNWASAAETGMPEHPLYEQAPRDPQTGVMRVDDVGLCSLWTLDAFALMRMGLQLNDLDQATHLENEISATASRVGLTLWDPVQGIYRSRDWDGFPTDRQSATVLLALCAGIPAHKHLDRLLTHLSDEFNTPFLLPTLGKADPDFEDQLPWRGRVSPLLNYLICDGLRQYGQDELAETISLSGLEMMSKGWHDGRHVYASYNSMTGAGDDIEQDPLAPSGILLGALGISMLVDVEPWNGLRMGNLRGVDLAINGFHLLNDVYDFASGPWGLSAKRNGDPWFDLDRPAIMRNLVQTDREISCGIKMLGGGRLRLRFHGYEPGQQVSLKINGNANPVEVNSLGDVDCTIDFAQPSGGFGIRHRAA